MRSRVAAFRSSSRSKVAVVISPRLTSSPFTICVLPSVKGPPFSDAGIVIQKPVPTICLLTVSMFHIGPSIEKVS